MYRPPIRLNNQLGVDPVLLDHSHMGSHHYSRRVVGNYDVLRRVHLRKLGGERIGEYHRGVGDSSKQLK